MYDREAGKALDNLQYLGSFSKVGYKNTTIDALEQNTYNCGLPGPVSRPALSTTSACLKNTLDIPHHKFKMNPTIITNNADILNRQEMRGGTNELAKALDRVAAREAAQGVDKVHMLLMTKEEAAKFFTRSAASATSTTLLQLESLNT